MFTGCAGRIDSDPVVRRLTQAKQGRVPPELRMVSPELPRSTGLSTIGNSKDEPSWIISL